jgi:haloacetate dehalogenase
MLEAFIAQTIGTQNTRIFTRRAGAGAPILLLHGFPQTHTMWHQVAPSLARNFTVVCADLRGYGCSGKPASTADHEPYSKRAMALDMIEIMRALGFEQFAVVGHDRGARVAYRMALDHPGSILRLAVFDIIPTLEVVRRTDAGSAFTFWPWSLLSQPAPLPENLLSANPEAVVNDALANWGSAPSCFTAEARAAYVDALRDPDSVHAICEEYRAALTCDLDMDEADQTAGRKIIAPALALWSQGGGLDTWYQSAGGPLEIWKRWAMDVSGRAIRGGHFFPEQNPTETISELESFLARS